MGARNLKKPNNKPYKGKAWRKLKTLKGMYVDKKGVINVIDITAKMQKTMNPRIVENMVINYREHQAKQRTPKQ